VLLDFYRKTIRSRKSILTLNSINKILCFQKDRVLLMELDGGEQKAMIVFHSGQTEVFATLPWPPGRWHKDVDSAEERWGSGGSRVPRVVSGHDKILLTVAPLSFALLLPREDN
jgi:hypothetical protein